MNQLTTASHSLLTEYALKLLHKKNIRTIDEFIRTDVERLIRITNLDGDDIRTIFEELSRSGSMIPVDGLTYHNQLLKRASPLRTYIDELDELLLGGLPIGNVIDLCGLSASGKTQLCSTIAVNLSQFTEAEVLWIDTKADFSGQRIYRMLKHRKLLDPEAFDVMRRIKVEACDDPKRLIEMISEISGNITAFERVKLLVIDSLPALWFLLHGEQTPIAHRLLAELSNRLRRLAVESGIVIITLNIVTRWNETIVESANDTSNFLTDAAVANRSTGTPALGKFWRSACAMRLLISKLDSSTAALAAASSTNHNNNSKRFIRIIKCNQLKCGTQCSVNLTDAGVV